jgi:hypothetical protein
MSKVMISIFSDEQGTEVRLSVFPGCDGLRIGVGRTESGALEDAKIALRAAMSELERIYAVHNQWNWKKRNNVK